MDNRRGTNRVVDIIVDLGASGRELEGGTTNRAGRDGRDDVGSREVAVKLVLDANLTTDLCGFVLFFQRFVCE